MLKTLQLALSLSQLLLNVLQQAPSLPPTTVTSDVTNSFSAPATAVQKSKPINLPSGLEMAPIIAKVAATEAPNITTLEQPTSMVVPITIDTTNSEAIPVAMASPTKITTINYEVVPVLAESSVTNATPYGLVVRRLQFKSQYHMT
ncbi:unnamed protein product [Arabis nemorensis]|uniref:Uncharacterized protein n=1 Tax=Arabis nemorensis TaxID=586526 RepID=A0A565BKC0_9BRAS|nr:unnamed protein product [Arabis nemorensis]